MVERNCFLYNLAQLVEDGFFILAVAPTVNQARRAPDKALVLFRPLDDLRVPRTFLHDFDSSTARFTARTW
ncbi:MAG: hypothetical protein ACREUO_10240, partial [Burkholderiales bacterium]